MAARSILAATLIALVTLFNGCSKDSDPIPTSFEITILDDTGNVISGANVELYLTQSDMENSIHPVGAVVSDASGKARFSNLDAAYYYWFAEKGCQNNVNGAITNVTALKKNAVNSGNSILSATGKLRFENNSGDPYSVYVNGNLIFTAEGGQAYVINYAPIGTYSLRVVQLSGYSVFPTDLSYSGTLACGGSLTTSFPD